MSGAAARTGMERNKWNNNIGNGERKIGGIKIQDQERRVNQTIIDKGIQW